MNSPDPPSRFLNALKEGLAQCGLSGGRVLVGVSGGTDSVALLTGLHRLTASAEKSKVTGPPLEVIVAHVDHQLREDSATDAAWVRNLAEQLGLSCRIEAVNVADRMVRTGGSTEEAARNARYETLVRVAEEEGCAALAVAHHADDQAETILHHLVRGTSVTGLRGMRWARPMPCSGDALPGQNIQLIRPMLGIRRAELEAWLEEIGQNFRDDSTNTDDAFTRNRIRHELLPLLEQSFNPQIRKALTTLAGHAAEVSNLLSDLALPLVQDALVQSSECSLRISCPPLENQHPILIRETLLTVWRQANWPLQRMGHREWQKLCDLVQRDSGAVSLPERIDARRRGQLLILSR